MDTGHMYLLKWTFDPQPPAIKGPYIKKGIKRKKGAEEWGVSG